MLQRLLRRLGLRPLDEKTESSQQPGVLPPLSVTQAAEAQTLRQGDVVLLDKLPITSTSGVEFLHTSRGVVVLTQTCDAVRREKLTVTVAPVVPLAGNAATDAIDGKLLRYVHLPSLDPPSFADMSVLATVGKSLVLELSRVAAIDPKDDQAIRRFGRAIGRRFGRFPFPDEVVPWLRPLEVVVQSKHDKSSPEGAAMRDVVELRIQSANGWNDPPFSLTLCVIVKPGTLPSFPDETVPECPAHLETWLRSEDGALRQGSHAIAERLAKSETGLTYLKPYTGYGFHSQRHGLLVAHQMSRGVQLTKQKRY